MNGRMNGLSTSQRRAKVTFICLGTRSGALEDIGRSLTSALFSLCDLEQVTALWEPLLTNLMSTLRLHGMAAPREMACRKEISVGVRLPTPQLGDLGT